MVGCPPPSLSRVSLHHHHRRHETYTYDGAGQLTACTGCGTVDHDSAGRTTALAGWTYEYDAEGRLTTATETATGDRLEMAYDAAGHRTQLREYTAGVLTRTRDLRYQGDAIVDESVAGTVVRSYSVTDAGQVVSMTIPAGQSSAGVYLPTWNGHGDALALWRMESDGTLTLANSYTYSTWGRPTTATHNGIPDVGFRFLYVGASDVQWDDVSGAGLLYMHARHYSPLTGRFLQPDPSAAEANLYAYAGDSPVTKVDPSGLDTWWRDYRVVYRGVIEFTGWMADLGQVSFNYLCAAILWRSRTSVRGGLNGVACWGLSKLVVIPERSDRVVNEISVYGNDVVDRWEYWEYMGGEQYRFRGSFAQTYRNSPTCRRWASGGRYFGLAGLPLQWQGKCGSPGQVAFQVRVPVEEPNADEPHPEAVARRWRQRCLTAGRRAAPGVNGSPSPPGSPPSWPCRACHCLTLQPCWVPPWQSPASAWHALASTVNAVVSNSREVLCLASSGSLLA